MGIDTVVTCSVPGGLAFVACCWQNKRILTPCPSSNPRKRYTARRLHEGAHELQATEGRQLRPPDKEAWPFYKLRPESCRPRLCKCLSSSPCPGRHGRIVGSNYARLVRVWIRIQDIRLHFLWDLLLTWGLWTALDLDGCFTKLCHLRPIDCTPKFPANNWNWRD